MKTNLQKAAFLMFSVTIIATSIIKGGKHHTQCEACKLAMGIPKEKKPASSIASISNYSIPGLQDTNK